MRAERSSAAPRPPTRMSSASALVQPCRRRERERARVRSAIVASRRSLVPDQVGRVGLFSNTREAAGGREPPLLLLHGIHPSASAHELRPLFDTFREERPVYAPDLPGFGSSERAARAYTPELYVRAIESLIEHAAQRAGRAIDVVAIGLTCEYAAQAVVDLPERVRSLVLISPTGFAVKREQGPFERASRRGKSLWPVSLLGRLGASQLLFRLLVSKPALRVALRRTTQAAVADEVLRQRYATTHQPGSEHAVLALLAGTPVPRGNPQSVYTRVHCPALVLYAGDARPGFGSLALFVKWREHFSAEQIADASLLHAASAGEIERRLRGFWLDVWARDGERELAGSSAAALPDIAVASRY
jgi:pimeloyl-ACP methyl ester carboxylesterase